MTTTKAIAKDLDGALDHYISIRRDLELGSNPFSSYADEDNADLTAKLVHAANDVVSIADELLQSFGGLTMIDLRAIRLRAGMTQEAVAHRLGLSPVSGHKTVSQIEARRDWLVSSVAAFVEAVGGSAVLVVTMDGEEINFPLGIDTHSPDKVG